MDLVDTFEQHRSFLFGIAYRMLGTVTDAQDVVQDAWLRWSRASESGGEVELPRAFLARIVTRLAIDRLRQAQARREDYIGPWLPEPLLVAEPEAPDTPETHLALAESLRMAFLVVLERLSPVERAVFLLRDVFDYDYADIAAIVEKSEANCRQIFVRARRHLKEARPRPSRDRLEEDRVAAAFLAAIERRDAPALEALLAADVVAWGDGGGKAFAARRPIAGVEAVGRFLLGLARTAPADLEIRPARINHLPGFVAWSGGRVLSTMCLDVVDGHVQAIRSVVNPDKLAHLQPHAGGDERAGEVSGADGGGVR